MEAYDKARHVVEGLLNEPDPGSTWHLYIARYLLKVSSLLSQGQVETDDSHGDDLASYQKPEELPWSFRVMDEFIDCSSQTRTNSDLKGRLREVTEKFISLLSYGEPEPVDRTAGACLP